MFLRKYLKILLNIKQFVKIIQGDWTTENDLGKELEESRKKAKELEERLIRLAAEFENYKKRSARENEMLREASSAEMVLKVLPIVDEFEIALSHMGHAPAKE